MWVKWSIYDLETYIEVKRIEKRVSKVKRKKKKKLAQEPYQEFSFEGPPIHTEIGRGKKLSQEHDSKVVSFV